MSMFCWKCGKPLEELSLKISFRALCPHCDSYLHVCKGCKNYEPGRPNDCKIPGTEPIADREARNSCEEFVFQDKAPLEKKDPKEAFKRLFGDEP